MAKNQPTKVLTKKHLARLQREKQQIRAILYVAIGVVALVVLLIGYGILNQTVLKARQPVARVGTVNISTQAFQAHVRLTRQQMVNQYTQYYQLAQMFGIDPTSNSSIASTLQQIQAQLDDSATLGEYVLNEMINSILLRQEATDLGISVSSSEVDQFIQNALGYTPGGTPTPTITPTTVVFPTLNPTELALVTITPTASPFPTPTSAPTETQSSAVTETQSPSPTVTLIPSITPTPTEYTLASFQEQYSKALDKYKTLGFSEAQVRQLFEDSLLREKIYAVITKDVTHTSEEVWARHILVADLDTAMKVRAALKNGGDWESLAKQYSIDTGSSGKGGDLGWFPKGVMVTEFEDAAFSLSIGEISQPIKTKFGYHLIQVIGHEERPLSADDFKKKTDQFFNDWLTNIKLKSDIKIFDYYKDRIPTEPALTTTTG